MSEEHTDNLKKARAKLIEQRRAFVKVLWPRHSAYKPWAVAFSAGGDAVVNPHEPGVIAARALSSLASCEQQPTRR
jgi:hypothetical protein